ncbi:MAG: hypothetical protein QOA14_01590 [Nitrososphaeraceae archaeon]|nr:hypothetical protein [Nitrososphaeraceae archaeon]MDW0169088.1 hypothetical protein [Nitrososphaeraceae archaeon]MDW0172139.1 hypothetical protein [Nitrososphaeraceae archaeon]MDW0172811.1 hypothetical protein [Nitrososphaeraceae archaeon]MDW0174964.1 hypothetical protein [Nitrososphaeraceae archaeon]
MKIELPASYVVRIGIFWKKEVIHIRNKHILLRGIEWFLLLRLALERGL